MENRDVISGCLIPEPGLLTTADSLQKAASRRATPGSGIAVVAAVITTTDNKCRALLWAATIPASVHRTAHLLCIATLKVSGLGVRRGTDYLLWGKMQSSKDSAVCFSFPSSQSSTNCTLSCLYVFQCFQAGEAGLPIGLGLLGTAQSPGLGPCQPQRSRLCLCACLFVFN